MGRLLMIALMLAGLALPALASDLEFFRTPSKNIHCIAYAGEGEDEVGTVACDILEVTRRTVDVPRPDDCENEWGDRFEIGRTGRPQLVCHGDTLISEEGRTLAYGKSLTFGGVTCRSSAKGLECTNREGHGFFLSKARQRLF